MHRTNFLKQQSQAGGWFMLVAAPQLREQESECHTAVPGTAAPALRPQEGQHGPWALCSSVCCSPPRISSSPYARHVLHVTQQHTAFLRGFDSGQENDQLKKKKNLHMRFLPIMRMNITSIFTVCSALYKAVRFPGQRNDVLLGP